MKDPIYETTADEEAKRFLEDAILKVGILQDYLESMKRAMQKRRYGGFGISWCDSMMYKALSIHRDVSQCNGAAVVEGKK